MITARETPVSELPRAIAEAMKLNYEIEDSVVWIKDFEWHGSPTSSDSSCKVLAWEFNPFIPSQFHELTGDPETHAKICGVLEKWFTIPISDFPDEISMHDWVERRKWYKNPAYLTENGGWRAWWLKAYLETLHDGGDDK